MFSALQQINIISPKTAFFFFFFFFFPVFTDGLQKCVATGTCQSKQNGFILLAPFINYGLYQMYADITDTIPNIGPIFIVHR